MMQGPKWHPKILLSDELEQALLQPTPVKSISEERESDRKPMSQGHCSMFRSRGCNPLKKVS